MSMAASSQQRVTVFFFQELTDSSQLRLFEDMRNSFQEKWYASLFSRDGLILTLALEGSPSFRRRAVVGARSREA